MATHRKLKSGKHQFLIRVKGHKPITKTFRTKAQGRDWAIETEDKIRRGQYQDTARAEKILMKEIFEDYEKDVLPNKSRTWKSINRNLIDYLGDYSLAKLTADHVVDFAYERLEECAGETVRKDIGYLSRVIDHAVAIKQYHIAANPCQLALKILRARDALAPGQERDRRLTEDEYQALISYKHVKDTHINKIVEFAVETAMRRGEIVNMQRKDRKGDTLHIPKTKTGVARTIPLSPRAVEILESLPARIDGSVWGVKPDSISQAFGRMCASLGIEDLRFHDLRHEGTSRLFERGWKIPQVAVVTGHRDWKSLKRYTNLKAEDLAREMRKA